MSEKKAVYRAGNIVYASFDGPALMLDGDMAPRYLGKNKPEKKHSNVRKLNVDANKNH